MNVADYGQSLREIGTKNLEALASLERAKQDARWETDVARKKGTAESVGTMAGGVAGFIKGDFNRRKDEVQGEQNLAQAEWDRQNLAQRMGNLSAGRPADFGMQDTPARLQFKPYDAWQYLDDIGHQFRLSGMV